MDGAGSICNDRRARFRRDDVADTRRNEGGPYAFGLTVLLFCDPCKDQKGIHTALSGKQDIRVQVVPHEDRPGWVDVV